MFLNMLLTPKVGDATTAPQTGPLDPTPSSGMQPVVEGFADAFLAESPGDQVLSETSFQAAFDPSAARAPNPESGPPRIGKIALNISGDKSAPALPELAPVVTDGPRASQASAAPMADGIRKVEDPAVLIDQTRKPTAGGSALSSPETSISEVIPRQAKERIETAATMAKAAPQDQNKTPDIKAAPDLQVAKPNPRRLAEAPDFSPERVIAPTRPAEVGPASPRTDFSFVEPNVQPPRLEATQLTTKAPVSASSRALPTRGDFSDADLGADVAKETQASTLDVPIVGKPQAEEIATLRVETRSPDIQSRATDAAFLRGSSGPQSDGRANSVEERVGLTTETVRVVIAAKSSTPEETVGAVNLPEITVATPARKEAPIGAPSFASSNSTKLNTPGGRYDGHKLGRLEDVSSHGRGREYSPYQNAAPTPPVAPAVGGPTAGYPPPAPYGHSLGLAFNSEATFSLLPEEAAIQPATDAEISRFDLVSRDPVVLQPASYLRSEHVRHPVVMSQVAEAARGLREGQMEITLVPEELGRVRLTMTPSEAGMAVSIVAERPETLELMRRNIELLARDLSSQGFENLSFSFGGSGADAGGSMANQKGASTGQDWSKQADLTDNHTPVPLTTKRSGLDLRL